MALWASALLQAGRLTSLLCEFRVLPCMAQDAVAGTLAVYFSGSHHTANPMHAGRWRFRCGNATKGSASSCGDACVAWVHTDRDAGGGVCGHSAKGSELARDSPLSLEVLPASFRALQVDVATLLGCCSLQWRRMILEPFPCLAEWDSMEVNQTNLSLCCYQVGLWSL